MSWIPDIPRTLVLIKRLEAGENTVRDAAELFWVFCTASMSPEEFRNRMAWWRDYHVGRKRGEFLDPEIEAIMIQGFSNPDGAAQAVVERLDTLCERTRVPYHPDEKDDSKSLFVYAHISSSRLIRLLNLESYSERTRETVDSVINTVNRCNSITEAWAQAPWPKEYSKSLLAISSLAHITQFHIMRSDGEYENAIKSLAMGVNLAFTADLLLEGSGPSAILEDPLALLVGRIGSVCHDSAWMKDLKPQQAVDCFEAIQAGNRIQDPKALAGICSYFAAAAIQWWSGEEEPQEVKDAKQESWNLPEYWQHALGLVEGHMRPSDLRELLNGRGDEDAQRRLCGYFFGDELWAKLPQRARSSLISADRDWFGGSLARIEAVPNELKIAAEELLLHGLWIPLEAWVQHEGKGLDDRHEFVNLRRELQESRKQPSLSHLEQVCRMPITTAFLRSRGVSEEKLDWFARDLPNSLSKLRLVRNRAEHTSVDGWTRQGIRQFVSEFIGIGQLGILPRLAEMLLS